MTHTFTVEDEVVERVPHYAFGTGVVVVGEVVGTAGPDDLVVGPTSLPGRRGNPRRGTIRNSAAHA